jgi:hypothetical protein
MIIFGRDIATDRYVAIAPRHQSLSIEDRIWCRCLTPGVDEDAFFQCQLEGLLEWTKLIMKWTTKLIITVKLTRITNMSGYVNARCCLCLAMITPGNANVGRCRCLQCLSFPMRMLAGIIWVSRGQWLDWGDPFHRPFRYRLPIRSFIISGFVSNMA